MPPKKSNLNNQRSRHARRDRAQRHSMSTNQTITANATERCTQDSNEHRDERLWLQRER